jgi:hypothetical protein
MGVPHHLSCFVSNVTLHGFVFIQACRTEMSYFMETLRGAQENLLDIKPLIAKVPILYLLKKNNIWWLMRLFFIFISQIGIETNTFIYSIFFAWKLHGGVDVKWSGGLLVLELH